MTHAASRRRGGTSWILPVVALLAVWLASVIGWVSRSVIPDFLAWWPVWLALAGLGVAVRGRRLGRFRAPGLVALAFILVLMAFLTAHLQGWPVMPSSRGSLVGGDDGQVSSAAMSARVGLGDLVVSAGSSGILYSAETLRSGGEVGLPNAVERSQDDTIAIDLMPIPEPGWYLFSGWEVVLSPTPSWSLTLQGSIEGDLTALQVENLQLEGRGTVRLGPVDGAVPASVGGDFIIEVPRDQPVRVIGPASVPEDWVHDENHTRAPVEGQGWIISVAPGSVVRVVDR